MGTNSVLNSISALARTNLEMEGVVEGALERFFPQFLAALKERTYPGASVAVVGASDGKFVMPLAAAGYRVIAIECDPLALHGGEVRLPGETTAQAMGLIARLKAEDLRDQVQIVERDFLANGPCCDPCDPVWTSCSWHSC